MEVVGVYLTAYAALRTNFGHLILAQDGYKTAELLAAASASITAMGSPRSIVVVARDMVVIGNLTLAFHRNCSLGHAVPVRSIEIRSTLGPSCCLLKRHWIAVNVLSSSSFRAPDG